MYTNLKLTVNEFDGLDLPNASSTAMCGPTTVSIPATPGDPLKKLESEAKQLDFMLVPSDFKDFSTKPPIDLLNKVIQNFDILLAPHQREGRRLLL